MNIVKLDMAEIKLDLHLHTQASFDSVITLADIEQLFNDNRLDQVAITDHNEINMAREAAKRFGAQRVIVGEEVTVNNRKHIIGLFLNKFVPKGLSAQRTCELIKSQGGLVYIPHPFDPKTGVGDATLRDLVNKGLVDAVETFNAWMHFTVLTPRVNKSVNARAKSLAEELNLTQAVGSDAHTKSSLGGTYNILTEYLELDNFARSLKKAGSVETYNKFDLDVPRALLRSLPKRFSSN
jgi:predicted metal-dependent phosphoesterase TrpH